MSLRTDDLQTTKFRNPIAKLNIGTTTGHIRCDRNGTLLSGICNNLCLQLMELRIQDFMRNACFLKFLKDLVGKGCGNGFLLTDFINAKASFP